MVEILEHLVAAYPKSVYVDLAYYELAGHYGLLGEPEKTHDYLRKLVLDYPNSHFVLKAIPGLLRQMSKDQQIEFLKEIINKNPDTRASDLAESCLENLEDEKKPKE